ncbi:MAG: thiamine pyrophosphate-dependent enzyme, partial [Chloroflexota bacterium]|nr:thiamine pyrophosphate-dependent enzyme [Chloroflexota bacterium]
NFPFREPLLPLPDEEARPLEARPDRAPWVRVARGTTAPDGTMVERLARELAPLEKGLIVCGPQDRADLAPQVSRLASRLGYPILADGLSLVRSGPHDRSLVLDSYDAFLRYGEWADRYAPDVVLRFGAAPTSKPLVSFLQRHAHARQIFIDEVGGWRDPSLQASEMLYADPVLFCRELAARLSREGRPSGEWAGEWVEANARTRHIVGARLGETESLSEAGLFAELSRLLPDGAALYVGNSMPVRDLDTFFASSPKQVRTLCNRGTNGIDGAVSSALGVAAVLEGPLVLAIGDLSFYHDMNGLLAAKLHGLNATILLINNDGGGIFSFLPQRQHPEHFEALFGTPTGLDFQVAVRLYGGEYVLANDWCALRQGLTHGIASPGLTVVEVRTNREENARLHRELWAAVEHALQPSEARY